MKLAEEAPAPASLPGAPERRVTIGAARDLGVFVPDIQLPVLYDLNHVHVINEGRFKNGFKLKIVT